MGGEPYDKGSPSPEILARRTEKQWRHEDRELTSSHVLWNAAITANTVIVAASGIFVGNDKFPFARWLFLCIVISSVIAIGGIIVLLILLRRYDSVSAMHFLTISQPPLPPQFGHTESENKRRRAGKCYDDYRNLIEPLALVLFLANLIMFCVIIMCHKQAP